MQSEPGIVTPTSTCVTSSLTHLEVRPPEFQHKADKLYLTCASRNSLMSLTPTIRNRKHKKSFLYFLINVTNPLKTHVHCASHIPICVNVGANTASMLLFVSLHTKSHSLIH